MWLLDLNCITARRIRKFASVHIHKKIFAFYITQILPYIRPTSTTFSTVLNPIDILVCSWKDQVHGPGVA